MRGCPNGVPLHDPVGCVAFGGMLVGLLQHHGRSRRAKDPFGSLFGDHEVARVYLGPQLLEFFVDIGERGPDNIRVASMLRPDGIHGSRLLSGHPAKLLCFWSFLRLMESKRFVIVGIEKEL